jgi:membrane protein DedA with SNARE-associated domain
MSALSDFFLTAIATYGAPLFSCALFLGAVGFPIPASLLVVAAGAFARQGLLDPAQAAGLGLIGAVSGDSVGFLLGRWGGAAVSRRFGSSPAWTKTQGIFERNSRLAVFLTRFLLTPVAMPVNLMAGAGCRYLRFASTVLAGQSIWILGYGGLGYLFGSQWELISQFLSDLGGLALGLAVLAGGLVVLIRSRSGSSRGGRAPALAGDQVDADDGDGR